MSPLELETDSLQALEQRIQQAVQLVVRDVTARVKAERALIESERRQKPPGSPMS